MSRRNESTLWMHTDRTQTHVISCIYHIASSDDSEPWPIVIEGKKPLLSSSICLFFDFDFSLL